MAQCLHNHGSYLKLWSDKKVFPCTIRVTSCSFSKHVHLCQFLLNFNGRGVDPFVILARQCIRYKEYKPEAGRLLICSRQNPNQLLVFDKGETLH